MLKAITDHGIVSSTSMIMVTRDIQDAWNENGMYHFGNNAFLPFFENTTCRFQKEAILSDFLLFNQAQLVVNFQKSLLRLIYSWLLATSSFTLRFATFDRPRLQGTKSRSSLRFPSYSTLQLMRSTYGKSKLVVVEILTGNNSCIERFSIACQNKTKTKGIIYM